MSESQATRGPRVRDRGVGGRGVRLGNRHRARDPRAARDPIEDFFPARRLRMRAANAQANLVDLGYPGRAAGVECRGVVSMAVKIRARHRRADRARSRCLRARITSIPTCRRVTRSASTSCRSGQGLDRHRARGRHAQTRRRYAGASRGGRGKVHPRRPARRVGNRSEPCGGHRSWRSSPSRICVRRRRPSHI